MNQVFIILIIVLTSFTGFAQNKTIRLIDKNSYPLKSNCSNNEDLAFLSSELKGNIVVGLGEASHGTQEFYVQKRRIIEYLIANHDYKLIVLEFVNSEILPINQYLQTGSGDLPALMKRLALYNTEEIYKLFQWIREYNHTQPTSEKVTLVGCDSESFWENALTRDKLMAESLIKTQKIRKSKTIIWAHNLHLAKDTTMTHFKGMGAYLKQEFGRDFYVIGFDTYKGNVSVLDDGMFVAHSFETLEPSLSSIFFHAKHEMFFLSFTKRNPLIGIKNYITNIYSNWKEPRLLPIIPGLDFDGMIFIRNSSASVKFNWGL